MLHCVSTLWVTVCPHLRTQCVTLCVHTVEILLQMYQHCENGPNPHSRHTAFSPCCYDVYHHVATLCITMLPHCVSPCCHTVYHPVVTLCITLLSHCVSPCCHTVWPHCSTFEFNTVKYQPHCEQSPHCETPTVDHSVDTLASILKSDLTYISAACCYMQFSYLVIITRYYN